MLLLARQPGAYFIGQGVAADGVKTYESLDGIPMEQRLEFPVAEELQLGCGLGLAVHGNCLPILIYPRMDFLLRAMDQLVSHLDKFEKMSCGQWKPKVIIRTLVGGKKPLDAGPQHTNDFTDAFKMMLTNVAVMKIEHPAQIMETYNIAVQSVRSTLIVECL
jgi:pyruvate/2-oxoglutarate/acetoin dehydrogenase E1 component